MAAILETSLTGIGEREAAGGRFFDAQNPFRSSKIFLASQHDLLTENVGMVLHADLARNGNILPANSDLNATELSVVFDARRFKKEGEFIWELSMRKAVNAGQVRREVRQFRVNAVGVQATEYAFEGKKGLWYDDQPRFTDPDNPDTLAQTIQDLMAGPVTYDYIKDRRAKKDQAERASINFSLGTIGKFGVESCFKKEDELQKWAERVGFIKQVPFGTLGVDSPSAKSYRQEQEIREPLVSTQTIDFIRSLDEIAALNHAAVGELQKIAPEEWEKYDKSVSVYVVQGRSGISKEDYRTASNNDLLLREASAYPNATATIHAEGEKIVQSVRELSDIGLHDWGDDRYIIDGRGDDGQRRLKLVNEDGSVTFFNRWDKVLPPGRTADLGDYIKLIGNLLKERLIRVTPALTANTST